MCRWDDHISQLDHACYTRVAQEEDFVAGITFAEEFAKFIRRTLTLFLPDDEYTVMRNLIGCDPGRQFVVGQREYVCDPIAG